MRSRADIRRDELAAVFSAHDIWYAPRYCSHAAWCSRPMGHAVATIKANSADELQAVIAEELAEANALGTATTSSREPATP